MSADKNSSRNPYMPDALEHDDSQRDAPATVAEAENEALSHLYKMSTTSAGGQEYVAINPAAIAALLLGFASILAMASQVFMIVPAAAVICAIIALVKIHGSSGTQSGRLLACSGLALALAISGIKIGIAAQEWSQARSDTQQLLPIVNRLSQALHTARYDEAYEDLFSSTFQQRVDRKTFAQAFLQYNTLSFGPVKSVGWNGQHVEFAEIGTSGVRVAYMMALMNFERSPQPARPVITFSTRDGTWKIDNIESLFPEKKKGQVTPQ